MLIAHYYEIPTHYALATVAGILLLSVLASVIILPKRLRNDLHRSGSSAKKGLGRRFSADLRG